MLDLLGQVNVIEGVRASDHRGAEVGLVDTLLAVLVVESHVVILEGLGSKSSQTHLLDIFDLSDGAEGAWVQELVLWVVVKVDTRYAVCGQVNDPDYGHLAIYPVDHVVRPKGLWEDPLILPISLVVQMVLIEVGQLAFLREARVVQGRLAEESLVALGILLIFIMDALFVLLENLEAFLVVHRPCDFNCVRVRN